MSATPAPEGGILHIDMIGNAERALRDTALQRQLGTAMPVFRAQMASAAAEVSEWESLRAAGAAIKDHALNHLDRYLAQLETRAAARGVTVHWAADAVEARRIIIDLAGRHAVRRVVKSKSMTTEEIQINPALEAAGFTVCETDLGEYILQLAGEPPSHIIAPAVHKSAADVSALFAEKLGAPRLERPEDLAGVAREALRAEFLAADMGITGVNFAVAETGTLVVVENEGNARLTTTRPRIHVAVMGLEKVVPRLADLGVMLRLLPRAATGQRASVYVSLITGPRRPGEADGPDEVHLVILDNGRSRILGDPDLRDALRCMRCGACLNICPIFERTGGHAYDSVYSGPIGAVITPAFDGLDRAGELPFASSLCGACAEVCPAKIDLPRMLLELRARVVQAGKAGWLDYFFAGGWALAMGGPRRLRVLNLVGRMAQALVIQAGRMDRLPYPFSAWTAHRTAPMLPSQTFREWWTSQKGKSP